MNRLITITKERLEKAKTPKGGYKNAQYKVLDLEIPVRKGWKNKIIGSKVTLRTFIAFVKEGKNKFYLGQILDSLTTLNPPLIEPLDAYIETPKAIKPKRLSAKERKKEKRLIEKIALDYDREKKIRDYGINLSIKIITEKEGASITSYEKAFLNGLLKKKDYDVSSSDVKKLYQILKNSGISLRRINGKITPSGIQKTSELKKEQLLYIIREKNTDRLKIGISKNPKKRKASLQTSNPNILIIKMVFITKNSAKKLEKELHKTYRKKNVNGEWFEDITDNEIINMIGEKGSLTKDY